MTRAPGAEVVEVPEADPSWHPLAVAMFESLAESGQSELYEPSDWAKARLAAELTSRALAASRPSGQLLSVIEGMWSSLLVSETDRRRARVELQRGAPLDDAAARQAKLARMERYRKAAAGEDDDEVIARLEEFRAMARNSVNDTMR